MSLKLDASIADTGTKFRLFVQPRFVKGFEEPEVIHVTLPPDEIQAGPSDNRMHVLDAVNKRPYGRSNQRPFLGRFNPPIEAAKDGHFDHLRVDSRDFSCATMYATVRRVLDVWEDYFERRIEWHFRLDFDRMELIPLIEWDNAQSGYGFLEFGFARTPFGGIDKTKPYCQNFDVLAHELGHSIIFAEVGFPNNITLTDEYGGFHESAGDLAAIISALHFNKLVNLLLENSKGNLFTVNEITRVGEVSNVRQIRLAFNYERMTTVSREPHEFSLPLTGAIFDVFVEIFQKKLVEANLISQDLADRSYHSPDEDIDDEQIQKEFKEAYEDKTNEFKTALLEARDYLGQILALTWNNFSPHFLTYRDIGTKMLSVDQDLTNGKNQDTIRDCFKWREISLPSDSIALEPHSLTTCGLLS